MLALSGPLGSSRPSRPDPDKAFVLVPQSDSSNLVDAASIQCLALPDKRKRDKRQSADPDRWEKRRDGPTAAQATPALRRPR